MTSLDKAIDAQLVTQLKEDAPPAAIVSAAVRRYAKTSAESRAILLPLIEKAITRLLSGKASPATVSVAMRWQQTRGQAKVIDSVGAAILAAQEALTKGGKIPPVNMSEDDAATYGDGASG